MKYFLIGEVVDTKTSTISGIETILPVITASVGAKLTKSSEFLTLRKKKKKPTIR